MEITKEILRAEAKIIRAEIPKSQRQSDALQLRDNVIACLNDSSIHVIQNGRMNYTLKPCNDDNLDCVIGTYYPIGTEIIPPHELGDFQMALPVVRGKTTLEFYPWSLTMRLVKREFDIPIPDTRGLSRVIPDIILLPLLLCDRHGNRIGYGAGHYDRYIASRDIKPVLIGVCYEDQIYDGKIPAESHDVPLDLIVTPKRIINIT